MKIKLLILILLSSPAFVNARGYYFNTAYSNTTGAGTSSNPYHDMSKSISYLPGDMIFLNKGDRFDCSLLKFTNYLYIGTYGLGADPIWAFPLGTGTAYNRVTCYLFGSHCTVTGINFTYPEQSSDRSVEAYNCIGLEFDTGNGNFATLNTFSKLGTGIFISNSDSNVVSYNTFRDMRMIKSDAAPDNDYGANAVSLADANYNIVTHNYADSMFAPDHDYIPCDGGFWESYNPCSYNIIEKNTVKNCDGFAEIGSGSGGTSAYNSIRYNYIINCGRIAYTSAAGGFPVYCHNLDIFYNTFIDSAHVGDHSAATKYSGSEFYDTVFNLLGNLFYIKGSLEVISSSPANSAKTKRDYNVYCLSGGATVGASSGVHDKTSTANNEFKSLSTGDLSLKSTAISRGSGFNIGLSTDIAEYPIPTIPDIGARTYVGVTPPPPPSNLFTTPFIFLLPDGTVVPIKGLQ